MNFEVSLIAVNTVIVVTYCCKWNRLSLSLIVEICIRTHLQMTRVGGEKKTKITNKAFFLD
jgi:hypothetical protein